VPSKSGASSPGRFERCNRCLPRPRVSTATTSMPVAACLSAGAAGSTGCCSQPPWNDAQTGRSQSSTTWSTKLLLGRPESLVQSITIPLLFHAGHRFTPRILSYVRGVTGHSTEHAGRNAELGVHSIVRANSTRCAVLASHHNQTGRHVCRPTESRLRITQWHGSPSGRESELSVSPVQIFGVGTSSTGDDKSVRGRQATYRGLFHSVLILICGGRQDRQTPGGHWRRPIPPAAGKNISWRLS
jgi:hypothetical protein